MALYMNLQFYIEKLHNSGEFKKFMQENPEAYLCSGFFVIDKEKSDNQQHFDFYIPKSGQIFSFQMEKGIKKVALDRFDKKIPEKISLDYDFDFAEAENLILMRMKREQINKKIQKIMFSLLKIQGRDFITGTIFISGLGMLKLNIEPVSMRITDFEKISFFDMMRVVKKGG